MEFYIVPPRKIPGIDVGLGAVLSLNGASGDLRIVQGDGIELDGPSGGAIAIAVESGRYVRRAGDQLFGNLDLSPVDGGPYGLRLRAADNDPLQSAVGAIYYNTASHTLRGYDAGGWIDVGQMGSLTVGDADGRYLRLDGSNGPLSGNLSMGSALLRFGNLASDPVGGTLGQAFFDTSLGKLKVYAGADGWKPVAGGVEQLSAGLGLLTDQPSGGPIVSTGALRIDQAFSPVWTGTHQFSSPVAFAAAQRFPIAELQATGESDGDLVVRAGGAWGRLAGGAASQTLVYTASGPAWASASGGTTGLGAPSDGTFSDGFFSSWGPSTTIADAVDDVSELLRAIAPVQGAPLDGLEIGLTGLAFFAANVSAGNPNAAWYAGAVAAGGTTPFCTVSSAATLASPSPASAFNLGLANAPASFGTLFVDKTLGSATTQPVQYALAPNAGGSATANGHALTVVLSNYNSIWRIASAVVVAGFAPSDDGYLAYQFRHENPPTRVSAARGFFRDAASAAAPYPAFSTPASIGSVIVDAAKWLSGVRYYGQGTQVRVDLVAAPGIFNACYHPTSVATVGGVGASGVAFNPSVTPTYNAAWDCTASNGLVVTLDVANQSTAQGPSGAYANQYLTASLFKPSGAAASSNAALARAVCTWGSQSTDLYERFVDEDRRIPASTFPGVGAWSATAALPNGEAQARNGLARYPVSADYAGTPSFTGDQEYHRLFVQSGRKTGTITFDSGLASAFDLTQVSAYGAGDLNLLGYLEGDAVWLDFGVAFGTVLNGVGLARDGSSKSRAIGAMDAGSGARVLRWTFGTYTTGPTAGSNLGRFRFVAVFRNANRSIQSLTLS